MMNNVDVDLSSVYRIDYHADTELMYISKPGEKLITLKGVYRDHPNFILIRAGIINTYINVSLINKLIIEGSFTVWASIGQDGYIIGLRDTSDIYRTNDICLTPAVLKDISDKLLDETHIAIYNAIMNEKNRIYELTEHLSEFDSYINDLSDGVKVLIELQ